MIEVTDAIDRQVLLERPPMRVVSLVPSETLSVAELIGIDRIVGRTDYCVEPVGAIDAISSVGGTKGFDVDGVKALRPDLVLANKEENSRPQVQALIEAGLSVHVSFPRTVDQSVQYLETLCLMLGVAPDAAMPLAACRRAVREAREAEHPGPLPVFVPIWKDPWMTFDQGAYASDVLSLCGGSNVFADRTRRYPLSADLGESSPNRGNRVEGRDTRYPRIRLDEVAQRRARAVLLPDEPYAFAAEDARAFAELDLRDPIVVELVDGKDLFWYGSHLASAVQRLTETVARLRSQCFGWQANN